MNRLSDERVREIAETYLSAAPVYLYDRDGERLDLSEDEVDTLAREVLDLRARLTATEARGEEALQQRDAAVAIAREAVERLTGCLGTLGFYRDGMTPEAVERFQSHLLPYQGEGSLAARLAQIGGEDV